jgi:signal transduction histidine kinase
VNISTAVALLVTCSEAIMVKRFAFPGVPSRRVRLFPRSVRGQITALVTLAAMLIFMPTGVASAMVVRRTLTNNAWRHVRTAALITATAVRHGTLTNPIPHADGVNLVQVVVLGHRVIAASAAARGLPPISMVWPTANRPRLDVQTCAQARVGCVRISAERVSSSPDSPVVLAGTRVPGVLATGMFDMLFVVQATVLIALSAWGAWKVAGRTLRPVDAISTTLATINVHDVTNRVPEPATRDEIARLARVINDTLQRVERALEQQRQFTADVSHELRTPLAGLRVQLEGAQLDLDDTGLRELHTDLREVLDGALRDVDRIQSIVTDMLLLARIEARAPQPLEPVDLTELVRAQVLGRSDKHPIHLHLEPSVTVNASHGLLARVLANLLDNAQQHAKRVVHIEVCRNDGMAELIVSDDGEGIAEADRKRIFQRFTRLDSARSRRDGGTGLGLAIARNIAESYHGTLQVSDSPTGGARFVLRLPLAPRTTNQP